MATDLSPDYIDTATAAELRGVTRRAIDLEARRNDWDTYIVDQPGGGRKQFIAVRHFPVAVQNEWAVRVAESHAANLPAAVAAEHDDWSDTAQDDREKALARWNIVRAWRTECAAARAAHRRIGDVETLFVNNLPASDLITLKVTGVSIQTVRRWDKTARNAGVTVYPALLADHRKGVVGRPPSSAKAMAAERWCRSFIQERGAVTLTAKYLWRVYRDKQPDHKCSLRWFQNMVRTAKLDLGGRALFAGKQSTAYKNSKPRIATRPDLLPGECWEVDGKTMNNLIISPTVVHPNPARRLLMRPTIVYFRDRASGFIPGFCLTPTENFQSLMCAWAQAVIRWGLPQKVISDGAGSFYNAWTATCDFAERKRVTKAVTRARDLLVTGYTGFFDQFGVTLHRSIPGNPQSKAIEPANKLFHDFEASHSIFTGRKKEERPEVFSATIQQLYRKFGDVVEDWAEYVAHLTAWIDLYNDTPRPELSTVDGEMLSPREYYIRFDHRKVTRAEVETNTLLRFPKTATVHSGVLDVGNIRYGHGEFRLFEGRTLYVYPDYNNIEHLRLGSAHGQLWETPAQMMIPSSRTDKKQFVAAIKQYRRLEKAQNAAYLKMHKPEDVGDAEMLPWRDGDLLGIEDGAAELIAAQERENEASKADAVAFTPEAVAKELSNHGKTDTDNEINDFQALLRSVDGVG
ncbi:MAG: hypothetical protein K8R90_05330 [Candidatus Cloacimonetes bacterium]|nr:hypothetical protein [Candidatus Cloacimonadota bacterium]